MPTLTTQTKIKIAKILSAVILKLRRISGKTSRSTFRRGGLRWELDLYEGIDLAIFVFGCFERDVRAAYRGFLNHGSIVLDIGANIGAHTLPIAACVGKEGRVYAFEPTVFAIQKVQRNLALNPELAERVELCHALLNDGRAPAPESLPSSWNLSFDTDPQAHPQHGGSFKPLGDVTAMRLDDFVVSRELKRIDLIKLDVDGNEWSVLQGAHDTLHKHRPTMLMEFAPDYDLPAFECILQLFTKLGYRAFSLNGRREYPLEPNPLRRLIPKNGSINVLLRPKR